MDPREASEQCRRCDPDRINSRAEFAPQAEPYTRPCPTVAGAHFYAYLDERGCYKLGVHLDTAEVHYGQDHPATATAEAPSITRLSSWCRSASSATTEPRCRPSATPAAVAGASTAPTPTTSARSTAKATGVRPAAARSRR